MTSSDQPIQLHPQCVVSEAPQPEALCHEPS